MQIEKFLEEEIKKLAQTGSYINKEKLIEINEDLKNKLQTKNYERSIDEYIEHLIEATNIFLQTHSIRGISTSIGFSSVYINLLGGKSIHGQNINKETLFDIASMTKLYTVLLTLLLKENNILTFSDKIKDKCDLFSNLDAYTLEDLLYMRGEIRTLKRIDNAEDIKEAEEILKTLYLYDSDKKNYKYTDMGMIALSKLIEAEVKRRVPISIGYAGIMSLFLLEPLHLPYTTFFPKENIAGNGREDYLVNDPKARVLGGTVGSAGLFTNSQDLYYLAQELFSIDPIIQEKNLSLLTKPIENRPKGIGGLYQKYYDFSKTYVPVEYSNASFASEGTTGSVSIFDRKNKIHNAILVDSIDPVTEKKPENFRFHYNTYQTKITDLTLKLHLLQKYYQDESLKQYVLKL